MQTRPLVALCVVWVGGSMIACLTSEYIWWVLSGLSLILFSAYLIFPQVQRSILILGSVMLIASIYWHWNEVRNSSDIPATLQLQESQMIDQPVQGKGIIASPIKVDGDLVTFFMNIYQLQENQSLTTPEKVRIQLKLATEAELQTVALWQRGDHVKIQGIWKVPGEARNFNTFDYRHYLRTQYVHWIISAKGATSLTQTTVPLSQITMWTWKLLRYNDQVRANLGARIDMLFDDHDRGYMKGLLIGDSGDLDPETFASFSRQGLTHILAISGLHVAIYTAILLWLLRQMKITKERACLIVIVLLPIYVLLTGASPSAVRAGIMGMIGLYALSRGILKDGLHILCAACIGMLLYEPYYLLNVSFQLSFIVTAGLVIFVPLVQPLLQKLPPKWAGALAVTWVAQMISFPLTIYYFNQFSILSSVANFILVPIVSLIVLPAGSLVLALSYLWLPVANSLGNVISWINTWTFHLVDWIDIVPGMLTIWYSPSILWILLYYVMLYTGLRCLQHIMQWQFREQSVHLSLKNGDTTNQQEAYTQPLDQRLFVANHFNKYSSYHVQSSLGFVRKIQSSWHTISYISPWMKRRYIACCASGLVMMGLIVYGYTQPITSGAGTVQYLDVGQGDSILITTPQGKQILVDGGGTMTFERLGQEWRKRKNPYEIGNKLLVPLLKKRGIHHLDAVLLTHGDHDHAGGLQAVIEQIPVHHFIFNGTLPDGDSLNPLMKTILDQQIPLIAPIPGSELQIDDQTTLTFLAPETPNQRNATSTYTKGLPREENQNHYSVVFLLTMNQRHFLFTGDADQAEEQGILYQLQQSSTFKNNSVFTASLAESTFPIDVLKIGHHGSKTSSSSEWLQYWQPALSVISVGATNTYGHPTEEVLERIEQVDSEVARTDLQGEIQIQVHPDGEMLQRVMYPLP
ncbi:DNA internalization-related competence protein ComEC/Rec2 [Paenibacillus kyungheensis]|uniref:DNA internalization-related competence protein ComEC/Rec2 n=1 Tax=Paenibacillus kyungheensis TaxID=1452732 RepID=A0AAX3LYY5_9BACL|nr:DNA internalization-related competence protein ComEC/Rec2 [Paenibacillus kyungheensis]WCT54644.1 DNA internalization-related competence protein ComEC/Rec2 [Paenibacillus kyungheensis]